jgi:hypothetical protein
MLGDNDLCPLLLSETEESIFELPINDMLWRAALCHLRCQRVADAHHAEFLTKGCALFHVTFYEILDSDDGKPPTELWPCGELHSDGNEPGTRRRIRESALTVSTPSLNQMSILRLGNDCLVRLATGHTAKLTK